jgi:pyrroline-5-carboxylate reductase
MSQPTPTSNTTIQGFNFKPKVGIIGTGSLGENLAKMLLKHSKFSVVGSFRNQIRKQQLINNLGPNILLFDNNLTIAASCDIIILSVKPGQIKDVCQEINPVLSDNVSIISVAAAIPLSKLCEWLPYSKTIIRCMPNIPCSIDEGVITYYSKSLDSDQLIHSLFDPNLVIPVDSDIKIDISTLISGCGPAFFAWYVSCLKQIATDILPSDILNKMINQTMRGTAALLENTTTDLIIKSVASPRGATEAALSSFQSNGINEEINIALMTAQRRIEAISSTL